MAFKVDIASDADDVSAPTVKPPKRARLRRAIPRNPQGESPVMASVRGAAPPAQSVGHPHGNLGQYLHKKKTTR